MAKLVVISQTPAGQSHELGAHWVTIGRANGNAFQILDSSVSGQHCEVRLQGDELAVRDLRSTNGTFIKDKMISEGVVKAGETLRVGNVELRLEMSPPSKDAPVKVEAPKRVEPAVPGQKKFKVLLVDDSMAFLETFSELFEELSNRTWEIHTAIAADRALAILQQQQIALVVLDIGMPMLDGVQLLGIIQKRYPEIKKVVLTGQASESRRAACLANGAELFLEKPITPDGIKFVFNVLNDLLSWTRREGFSGTLNQVGLQDVIQIQCLARSSCILEVRNAQTRGEIYIESGAVIHAAAGAFNGERAFHLLLALTNGEFQLQPFKKPAERTVHGPWELLLMEAARARDEQKQAATEADTILIPKPAQENKPAPPPATPTPPASETKPGPPMDISPAAPKPGGPDTPQDLSPDTEFVALGDDIIVVSTYEKDGKWHAKEEPKKDQKK